MKRVRAALLLTALTAALTGAPAEAVEPAWITWTMPFTGQPLGDTGVASYLGEFNGYHTCQIIGALGSATFEVNHNVGDFVVTGTFLGVPWGATDSNYDNAPTCNGGRVSSASGYVLGGAPGVVGVLAIIM